MPLALPEGVKVLSALKIMLIIKCVRPLIWLNLKLFCVWHFNYHQFLFSKSQYIRQPTANCQHKPQLQRRTTLEGQKIHGNVLSILALPYSLPFYFNLFVQSGKSFDGNKAQKSFSFSSMYKMKLVSKCFCADCD